MAQELTAGEVSGSANAVARSLTPSLRARVEELGTGAHGSLPLYGRGSFALDAADRFPSSRITDLLHFQEESPRRLAVSRLGMHYARTGEAWLARLDENVEIARASAFASSRAGRVSLHRLRGARGYLGGCEWFVSR